MGNFASKMGWRSKSDVDHTSRPRGSRNSEPPRPRAAESDSDFHSAYLLPALPRLSSQSSISQAVFRAFRNSQMNPPRQGQVTRKPSVPQRPRWSRWFGRQTEEDVRPSAFKSSFTAGAIPMADAERNGAVHGRFPLTAFPCPPYQLQKAKDCSLDIELVDHVDSSGIPRTGVFPRTHKAQNDRVIARPVAAYATSQNSWSSLSSSSNIDQNEEPHPPDMNRARVVSNSSTWKHKSMQVEISVLSSDPYASNLNNTPPGPSNFRLSRQPYIP